MKISKNLLSVLMLLLAIVSYGQVQQEYDTNWTLEECIEYAQKNNLTIENNRLNVQRSEVNLSQAKANYYPSFTMGGGYGYNWGRSIDPTTNLFIRQQISATNVNGSLNWTIFAGNQIRNSTKQSQVDLEASIKDLEASQNNVLFDVIGFFMNVVFNEELLQTAKKQLESTEQQVDRTQRLVDAGSLPKADLLQLLSQKATNELNVINAENNLRLSTLQLKQLLLIPGTEEFNIEVPNIELGDATLPTESVESVYQIAEQTMPEIKAADLRVESSELAISISKGALYPTLSLNAGFFTNFSSAAAGERSEFTGDEQTVIAPIGFVQSTGDVVVTQATVPVRETYDNNFGRQFNDNFSQNAGLRLFIPVFQNLTNRSNYQRSIITNEQQKVAAKQQRQQMRQIIETAYNDVVAASQTYTQSVFSVEALEETYRATNQRYNLGAANFTEWQVASNNLFQAESDLLRAKYDYIFKQKVLDFYQGKPIEL